MITILLIGVPVCMAAWMLMAWICIEPLKALKVFSLIAACIYAFSVVHR